jgi:hypothetical protein
MWDKHQVPLTGFSALQLIAKYLFGIGGAPIVISRDTVKEDDFNKRFEHAVCLRFYNRGQTTIILDDIQIIEPGEVYTEGDVTGPGIIHDYNIRFIPNRDKTTPLPGDVNRPFVYASNHLDIRIFKRLL